LANSALKLTGIDAFYGDSHVLQKVSFELGEARLLGLLGRNGAGKSTCMNVTVGLLPPRAAWRWCRKAAVYLRASPCAKT
jgi:branched-chain amino acid transport system ATP-binding protein